MTNTYDTSMYPLGATQPKVLYNNASNLDEAVNGQYANWIDRFGVARLTFWGMENQFGTMLQSMGYTVVGDYVTNNPLTIARPNQIFSRLGEYYRFAPPPVGPTLPYTTVNNWAIDGPKTVAMGDAALRSQLASSTGGAGLVYGANRQVTNWTALKTTVARYDRDQIELAEVKTGAVGSGGVFFWDASSTATADATGGRTCQVTGVPNGRWVRKQNGFNVAMWGLVPNDPTAAAANAAAWEACRLRAGANTVYAPPGTFSVASGVINQITGQKFIGDSQNGGLGGTQLVGTTAGSIITHSTPTSLLEFMQIKSIGFSATIAGVSAIRQDNLAQYVSTLEVGDCNFQASLTECLYGNYIFLYAHDNTFGYQGTPFAGKHRHVYCYGNTASTNANVNVVERNRHYRAIGNPEALMWRGGFQLTSRNCNYEQMACRPVGLYGISQPTFIKDWFEVATNATSFVYVGQNTGDTNVYNTQGTLFENCWFEGTTGLMAQLVEIGAGGATVGFRNPGGTNCNGTAFTLAGGVLNAGISEFLDYGAFFGTPLYPSKVTGGHSFITPISPAISSRGYVDKPWFDGWTTAATNGWSKTAATTWSGAASTTDFGNRIVLGSTTAGSNIMWIQVPVAYFSGKVIAIRARGQLASGTGDTFQLAAGMSTGVPGDVPAIGSAAVQGFNSTMRDVVGSFYVDPAVAASMTYLNVGLRSGGWTGQTIVEAFDFWTIGGDILPHFAR